MSLAIKLLIITPIALISLYALVKLLIILYYVLFSSGGSCDFSFADKEAYENEYGKGTFKND